MLLKTVPKLSSESRVTLQVLHLDNLRAARMICVARYMLREVLVKVSGLISDQIVQLLSIHVVVLLPGVIRLETFRHKLIRACGARVDGTRVLILRGLGLLANKAHVLA